MSNNIIKISIISLLCIISIYILFENNKNNNIYETYQNIKINNNEKNNETINKQNDLLLDGDYPLVEKKRFNDNNYSKYWWKKPVFSSSYKQLTHNLRYQKNPDIGNSTPTEFSGIFYGDKFIQSNETVCLPPPPPENGIRVGYFSTDYNALY